MNCHNYATQYDINRCESITEWEYTIILKNDGYFRTAKNDFPNKNRTAANSFEI